MFYITTEESNPAATQMEQVLPPGPEVCLAGFVQSVRRLGKIMFLTLRTRSGFYQVSVEAIAGAELVTEGQALKVRGIWREEPRAPEGRELSAQAIEIEAQPSKELPFTLGKRLLGLALETELEHRPWALRHPTHYHRFAIQAALAQGFRQVLGAQGFHEIFTPKIVPGCAEGGAGMFELQYFGQQAYLTQSPQLYKQMLVGTYERVFEVGHVYRAEQHNTSRHLNEYVCLDLEMGFVESLEALMAQQANVVRAMFSEVQSRCQAALSYLELTLPSMARIPVLHLNEAKQLVQESGVGIEREQGSLSAAEERALGAAVLERYGTELVFVTHYHASARPFYAREVAGGETETFDLLFRGMEITTGGLRIHQPEMLKAKMLRLGMNLEPFRHYLSAFEYGLPPHGGSGTGLERLTMLLCGCKNVRQTVLFPRDRGRVEP